MILIQKQKIVSWFDSYNLYDENNNIVFKVKGKLSWGHKVEIYDANNNYIGKVIEKIITLLPKYRFFIGENEIGFLRKKLTFFRPKFELDYNNWKIEGNIWELKYKVTSEDNVVMTCNEKIFSIRDTYTLNIINDRDALICAMISLAIDIDKCSSKRND